MVADDTLPMRIMLEDVLKEAGYNVITAGDGDEAWKLIQQEKDQLDLLILDLLMPKLTGFEILNKIRGEMEGNIPVLAITGVFQSEKDISRLKELGAIGYLTKTALVDEILFRVNQVFFLGKKSSRNFPRALMSLPVEYQAQEQWFSNYTSTLSAGGMFIRTIDPLPMNQDIKLRLKIPELDKTIESNAKVVWFNEYEPHSRKPSLPGMGVQFQDIDPEVQSSLEGFIKDRLNREPIWF